MGSIFSTSLMYDKPVFVTISPYFVVKHGATYVDCTLGTFADCKEHGLSQMRILSAFRNKRKFPAYKLFSYPGLKFKIMSVTVKNNHVTYMVKYTNTKLPLSHDVTLENIQEHIAEAFSKHTVDDGYPQFVGQNKKKQNIYVTVEKDGVTVSQ